MRYQLESAVRNGVMRIYESDDLATLQAKLSGLYDLMSVSPIFDVQFEDGIVYMQDAANTTAVFTFCIVDTTTNCVVGDTFIRDDYPFNPDTRIADCRCSELNLDTERLFWSQPVRSAEAQAEYMEEVRVSSRRWQQQHEAEIAARMHARKMAAAHDAPALVAPTESPIHQRITAFKG